MAVNVSRIPTLAAEGIGYMGWLEKVFLEAGRTTTSVEHRSPEVANEAKSLVWDGEITCVKWYSEITRPSIAVTAGPTATS